MDSKLYAEEFDSLCEEKEKQLLNFKISLVCEKYDQLDPVNKSNFDQTYGYVTKLSSSELKDAYITICQKLNYIKELPYFYQLCVKMGWDQWYYKNSQGDLVMVGMNVSKDCHPCKFMRNHKDVEVFNSNRVDDLLILFSKCMPHHMVEFNMFNNLYVCSIVEDIFGNPDELSRIEINSTKNYADAFLKVLYRHYKIENNIV